MPIIDRYILQPSPIINVDGRDQETVNLQLQPSPDTEVGNVSGTVKLSNGTPVPFATVMLFSSNGLPFEHNNSNPAGVFIFPRVPVGSYFITASEPMLLTPTRIPISVARNGTTMVNITMQSDPDGQKNALYGIVQNSIGNPLNEATVELFREVNATLQLEGIVSSNSEGQFLFAALDDATYVITASKPGFLANQSAPVALTSREFAPLNINLAADPDADTGTISGFIIESTNEQPIPNAFVALYRINGGTESVTDITKTNAGGFYMFGDLVTGTYRVKATVQVQE
ncbi:MSCRAMM family protein [Paenibacillus harenae]|uniref:5-hydroxyisourate hydrolase-like protein (Transthyretin family) n=1 Tax=Paenibacillus harenae TaxID=306543 RepID=A0ABT9U4Z5_PAEHA|nr:carboxypeptidase-like regulatory domain-containing protein [Paenibacillus harenae]MDQ0113740.1 5-hydroxyisourate hydrolase-like protein (transthyretin family) [Paenibacillus harenae]